MKVFKFFVFFVVVGICSVLAWQWGYQYGKNIPSEFSAETSAESATEASTDTPTQFGPEKAEAMLSLYIQDGANVSENYYLEVTSNETYKFCYFCNDGANIAKMELPCSKCELINSNDDLPHRVELYRDGDNITLARFFIPDDANTIQFDANND